MPTHRRIPCLLLSAMLATAAAPWGIARAGAPAGWEPGVEGQWGAGPAVWAPDGRALAVTRWDHAALLVVSPQGDHADVISAARGAGYAPVWASGRLLFKEVVWSADGARQHRIVLADPNTGQRWLLDRGERLGDPSISRTGLVVWSHGDVAVVRQMTDGADWPVVRRLPLYGYSNLVVFDAAGERLAFNHPDGSIGVADLEDGEIRWLTGAGAWSHPSWSDGGLLLVRAPGDEFRVLDAADGTELAAVQGTHPRWIAGRPQIVFERVISEAYAVVDSELFLLDLEEDDLWQLTAGHRHERHAAVSPDGGRIVYVDTRSGDLLLAGLGEDGSVGEPTVLLRGEELPWSPPPPSDTKAVVVEMPYMHQLWDTPNDFNGGWSCGPTSCIQTIQKYEMLPDHDITVDSPTSHVSHWGWYVPNEYSFEGHTYDIWGLSPNDVWVQGAHGYICRELGAAYWAYMDTYCDQHGLDSWQAGTSWGSLTAEVDAGYPMYASTTTIGYGHIMVFKGYETDHSLVANDPYGDANGSWGQYDGEGAVYDWPGYNNGHVELGLSQLFGARGPIPDPDPEWEASWSAQDYPAVMVAGQTATAWLEYLNEGTASWDTADTQLGTRAPQDRESAFHDESSWIAAHRPTAVDGAAGEGEVGRFSFTLRAPEVGEETVYAEHWGLVQEGVAWFGPPEGEVWFEITVLPADAATAPVADAGVDRGVIRGTAVQLDGSGSQDPDGEITAWSWQTPAGSLDGEQVEWIAQSIGEHQVTLTVTDDMGLTGEDTVTILVYAADGDEEGCSCSQGARPAAQPWLLCAMAMGLAVRRRRWR